MDDDKPFDRRLRRLRRDRAARSFADANYLHRLVAEELLERLSLVKRDFRDALVVGGADDSLAAGLAALGMAVAATDHGRILAAGNAVQCDEDRLPFAPASFDIVIALGTLDSVNDLPGALILIRRALRPDGLFLAAFAGAGSLPRLRRAMLAADAAEGMAASPRIHPQIDIRAAGDLMMRAGFALPVVDSDSIPIRFSGLARLVTDLRAMGGTNLLSSRSKIPIGKIGYAAANADFASGADADGKTEERFEITYLIGWAPAPTQPRPAARGSGTRSLASTLRPPG